MTLNEAFEITRNELFRFGDVSEKESISKINNELKRLMRAAKTDEKDREEIANRLGNLMIQILVVANKFGIKDMESLYRKRIVELQFGMGN